MDFILQRLLRKYKESPEDTDLAHQIVRMVARSTGSATDHNVLDVLPLCQYGSFLLRIINTYGAERILCIRGPGEDAVVMIIFQVELRSNSRNDWQASFELEQDPTILWPLQRAEDQAEARQAFLNIGLRDKARDIVYVYHVNDHMVTIDNELGATGWATQANFTSYLESMGFGGDINVELNRVEYEWMIPGDPLDPNDPEQAMITFHQILQHLNLAPK